MSWKILVLILNLEADNFCKSFIHYEPTCHDQIVECVLDGESLEWCKEDYLK